MPTLYVPKEAERKWLFYAKFYIDGGGRMLARLFTNSSLTIDDNTVLADFTEATYSGYSSSPAASSGVAISDITFDPAGRAFFLTDDIIWNYSGASPQTVYGAYYTDPDGDFIGAIKFGTPVAVSGSVRPDIYQQKFTLRQEPF